MTELFLSDLEREASGTRRVLQNVPEGRNDWKPHEKSMPMGYLAALVARMPAWFAMMIKLDEFDMRSGDGSGYKPEVPATNRELLVLFEKSLSEAREALANTTDEHLLKPWKFMVAGKVVTENPRHVMLRDTALNHMVHHRGQLTVYLRLNNAVVPAIYGPSADERGF